MLLTESFQMIFQHEAWAAETLICHVAMQRSAKHICTYHSTARRLTGAMLPGTVRATTPDEPRPATTTPLMPCVATACVPRACTSKAGSGASISQFAIVVMLWQSAKNVPKFLTKHGNSFDDDLRWVRPSGGACMVECTCVHESMSCMDLPP